MPDVVAERYQLGDVISDGEYATSYRAVDLHLSRTVVVRLLREEQADNPEVAQRFLDDARAAASYAHPNVVATYDAGSDNGIPYAVEEYVEGEYLDALIRDAAPLRTDRLRTIGIQLATALDYAQRHDSTRCSISAADVVVTLGDRIKVLRFHSVATARRNTDSLGGITSITLATDTGRNEAEPADVQSIGSLLYQMATGRHPFRREQDIGGDRPANHIVRPSALNPYISPSMERIILGALEAGPNRRFRSLPEVVLALQAQEEPIHNPGRLRDDTSVLSPVEPTAFSPSYREGPGWATVLLSTLVLAVVLLSAVYAAVVVRPQIQVPTVAALITGSDPSASRDSLNARNQAADLEKAIATVRGNTQKVSGMVALVRDRLTAEMSVVDGMRSTVDDMKRDASNGPPNPGKLGLLAAKRQSFELSYGSFEAARKAFADAANNAESKLAPMDADAGKAREAASALQSTLAQASDVSVQPRPGDEQGPLLEYGTAIQGARNDLSSMRKAEADLANVATSLRQQADDAAAMRISQQSPPAPQPTQGTAPNPTPGPGASPTPGPGASPTPMPSASATPGPGQRLTPTPSTSTVPRPTAPPPPRSAPTYPVGIVFAPLANQIGNVIGAAIEKEHADGSGNVSQRTTGGLLFWNKATGRAYFTDGFVTWVIGPKGLQSRPNDQQFDWEKPPPAGTR